MKLLPPGRVVVAVPAMAVRETQHELMLAGSQALLVTAAVRDESMRQVGCVEQVAVRRVDGPRQDGILHRALVDELDQLHGHPE